jgi:ABC-2 type transport system ATP-binding protein
MSVLEFRNIHRSYGQAQEVLSGVTFSVEQGQVVGLLGKNGAGKTTLIHVAMGMLQAQSGSVRVLGLDPEKDAVEMKRRVGFVSEDQILPPAMRVKQVVGLHRDLYPGWDAELEGQLRQRFSFSDRARVKSLSKGEARQLALLCAVSHRPELLILDEPAGGLDPAARREFLETSIDLLSDGGTSILFSSHYMSDVERMADRIVLLHDRQVLIDAELDTLRESYAVAVMPAEAGLQISAISASPACLRIRERQGTLRGVFRGSAEEVRSLLERDLAVRGASVAQVPLEELFVELLGGNS